MGTKMAPSYANIFMGILEKQMLSTYPHKPFIYFRYIDDVFMIWTKGKGSLNTFLEHCNKQNKHIKFKPTGTGTTVPFLDVSVTLKKWKITLRFVLVNQTVDVILVEEDIFALLWKAKKNG